MKDIKLEYLSASEIGRLVNNKQITPTEVLDYFIERINKYNDIVNAFVYTKFDYAYEKAKELESRLEKGENLGVFAGVPFALKDFLPSKKGWTHTYGGVKCLERVDEVDSLFCKVMEENGGIAIGKVNAPSYGFRGVTDNLLYGATKNPFNTKYNAGGSSGGSSAAVASGLIPIAEGGDAGGSIRVPASCCNLVGFVAGFGSIPMVNRPDAFSATHPYCVEGGLVKTVDEAIALYKLMAKYNSRDPYNNMCLRNMNEFNSLVNTKKPLKIAFTYDFDIFSIEPIIKDKLDEVVSIFKNANYKVDLVHFNFKHTANELSEAWCKGITIDCALDLNFEKEKGNDYLKTNKKDFPEEFIYYKELCDKMTIKDLYDFNLARTDVLDNFEDVFKDYDLIISPTMCTKPIKNEPNGKTKGPKEINGKKVESLVGWCETFLVNFVSYPAISLPISLTEENLPIGFQIIGRRYREDEVFNAAKIYEALNPWDKYYEISFNNE